MGRNGPCALCNMSIPTALQELVFADIRHTGRITFARFMQHALYDPEWGYYRASRSVVGKDLDFVTSVSATPAFGRLLAAIASSYAEHLGLPKPFELHEFGAHRGQLRADILKAEPSLEYRTYEVGDAWPEEMNGCVLANELLDALPFHRVHVQNGQWRELYVGETKAGTLGWVSGPLSEPELAEVLAPLPVAHMEGYQTEISLEARRWIETLGKRLKNGVAVLIDYGHELPAYFAPSRFQGGLRTFQRQRRGDDPFADLGERDITCDVHFTDVIERASQGGLCVWEFAEQGRFFTRHALRLLAQNKDAPLAPQEVRGLMTLTHPAHFGMAFKVLVLGRGAAPLLPGEGLSFRVQNQ